MDSVAFRATEESCDSDIDHGADPVTLIGAGRLESIAALNSGGRLTSFVSPRYFGLAGLWFTHRVFGFATKIGEAALSLPTVARMSGVAAVECFMETTGVDIARLTMIGDENKSADFTPDYQVAWGKSLHAGVNQMSHDILPLMADAEAFLAQLGRHTRRNVRRAERIAEELGMRFKIDGNTGRGSLEDIRQLAAKNVPLPLSRRRVRAYEALLANKTGCFESRFLLATGEVVSCCRGYIEGSVAYLVYQVNDPVVPRINLSVLHRFKLIEHLIGEGVSKLIFPFGCEGLFQPACEAVALEERVAIRRSVRGVATAIAVVLMSPRSQLADMLAGTLRAAFIGRIRQSQYGKTVMPYFSRQIGGGIGSIALPIRWERYAFGLMATLLTLGIRVALQDGVSDGIDFNMDTEFM